MKTKQELEKIIDHMGSGKSSEIKDLFARCPGYVVVSAERQLFRKGKEFIRAGEPGRYVFILIRGKARGIEFQREGDIYVFREFGEGSVLGDFEVFGELDECRVSICATVPCEMLVIPAEIYRRWMKEDAHALYMRVRDIMRTLTYQMSDERALFHLSCRDRLILLILEQYPKEDPPAKYKIRKTQRELAEVMSVTVRTVQRTISGLVGESLVSVEAGKICVNRQQVKELENIRDTELYGLR